MQDYDPQSAGEIAGFLAIIGMLMIPFLIFSLILIISHWKIFAKAGKPGWACIVPIYNLIVLLEIVGKPVWWIFLFLIPCVNFVFIVWTINLLSKSFGQGEGFTVGLLLLGFIFYPILAFGNYPYLGPAAAEARNNFRTGPFTDDPFNKPPQI
jgi:hypothetical protein